MANVCFNFVFVAWLESWRTSRKKAAALNAKHLHLQPLIIIINEDLAKLGDSTASSYHVAVQSDLCYEMGSLLEAVDLCLKTVFVFHLNYPTASQSSWLYLLSSKFLHRMMANTVVLLDLLQTLLKQKLSCY